MILKRKEEKVKKNNFGKNNVHEMVSTQPTHRGCFQKRLQNKEASLGAHRHPKRIQIYKNKESIKHLPQSHLKKKAKRNTNLSSSSLLSYSDPYPV